MSEQPLDPNTLRVVIDRLTERIIAARECRDGAADILRANELDRVRIDLDALLATTSDRARVVVLPEPDQIGGQNGSEAAWKLRGKGGYYVMANRILGAVSQAGAGKPEQARARALAILAAIEFAGGAK